MTGCTKKYISRRIAAFIALTLICSAAFSQVTVKAGVDRDRILIGEPIMLSVEAYVPLGDSVVWMNNDSIAHFEVIQKLRTDTSQGIDGKKISQLISLTSFDSGRWQIPAFEINVAGKPYFSDSITIDVAYVSFDPSEDYRDIKDIEQVENTSARYIPWIVGGLALLSLGLLILFFRRKPQAAPARPATPALSPYAEAIRALDELQRKGLPAEGEEKAYYSKLNDILRIFVLRKYGVATLERTNEELIVQLSRLKLPAEPYAMLAQSLRMSDFVKFAKYRPGAQENKENLDVIRTSIELLDNNIMIGAV